MLPEPLPGAPREGRSYSGRMSGADLDMRIQGPKHYIQRPTLSPSTRMSHLVTRNALPIYRAKCCKLPIRFSAILGQITKRKDSSASTLNLKFFGQGLQGREAGRTLGWGKSSPHQSPLDRHLRHPDNRPRLSRQKARTSLAQRGIPPAHWPSIVAMADVSCCSLPISPAEPARFVGTTCFKPDRQKIQQAATARGSSTHLPSTHAAIQIMQE